MKYLLYTVACSAMTLPVMASAQPMPVVKAKPIASAALPDLTPPASMQGHAINTLPPMPQLPPMELAEEPKPAPAPDMPKGINTGGSADMSAYIIEDPVLQETRVEDKRFDFIPEEKRMAKEARHVLQQIEAQSLEDEKEEPLKVRKRAKVEHGELKNPFPEPAAAPNGEDAGVLTADQLHALKEAAKEQDSYLSIDVEKRDMSFVDYSQTGYDAMAAGMYEAAVASYRKALQLQPENEQIMVALASAYHKSNQLNLAREMYLDVIHRNQNNWFALNNLIALAGQEAPEDALVHLKDLERVSPNSGALSAQIAMILIRMEKLRDAVPYLTRAASLDPKNAQYRYNLALLLEKLEAYTEARKVYYNLLSDNFDLNQLPENRAKIIERMERSAQRARG